MQEFIYDYKEEKKDKFDWSCFLPSKILVAKVILITLVFVGLGYSGVFTFLGQFTHIFKEVLHYGLFAFLLIYVTYFELSIFNSVRDYVTNIRKWIKNNIETYDGQLDTFMFQDIDEQVTCFSKVLQYLLTLIKIPEQNVKKITVKKISFSILYIPVFIFIIFWDIFFKGIVPYFYDKLIVGLNFLYLFLKINILFFYIKDSIVYKNILFIIDEYNLKPLLLVIVFVSLFGSMEILGIISITLIAGGNVSYGIYTYLAKFGMYFPIHNMHHSKAIQMREVKWFKIREGDVINTFKWIETLNAYVRVMHLLSRVKAVIKTIYIQLKKLLSAIKLVILTILRNTTNSILVFFGINPVDNTDSSLWSDLKSTYALLKVKLYLSFLKLFNNKKFILCIRLKDEYETALQKHINSIKKNRSKKRIRGFKSRVTITRKAYKNCIGRYATLVNIDEDNYKTKVFKQLNNLDVVLHEILEKKKNEG